MFKRGFGAFCTETCYPLSILWQLRCCRHRVSISSFKQWKDLLVFKRYDGHHVWNLPQFKPHEYGFRRIARKPPFFKLRKVAYPKVQTRYSSTNPFNRTLQIEYNWQQNPTFYHDLHEALNDALPGIRIKALPKGGDSALKVMTEDGRVLYDATDDGNKDVRSVVMQCYNQIVEH
uniref:Uncharacterized protein n=2 Tax=Babesia bovis TaxID=5865 RepID=A7AM17_BABBO|eukprot:XP_001611169.1 hypothetical protein [Babesia bovis T2Bo]